MNVRVDKNLKEQATELYNDFFLGGAFERNQYLFAAVGEGKRTAVQAAADKAKERD